LTTGTHMTLTASDGHALGAYRADVPTDVDGGARGGVVVLQEIFGVNAHIRDVCDRFARAGYVAIAPALYDRSSQKNAELTYSKDDVALGRKLREEFSWDDTILDVNAAAALLQGEGHAVGTVGYCWGGTVSFLAATRLEIRAAVVYYGGQIMPYVTEVARCPLLMHFGADDASIPLSDVEAIRKAHPNADVHVYEAGHGFNCDRRGGYNEAAATTANERTLALFEKSLT
jgi:carboxymethylenebutenolidase